MQVDASQTVAVALSAGVFAQCAARVLRIPGIVVLLALGVVLGPEVAGWVRPASLGDFLFWMVDFAVAVVLFEGGLNLEVSRLRREEVAIRRLVTVGAMVTLVLGTVAVRYLLEWSWPLASLFGSLVVVTGPTVVTPLLRHLRLRPRVRTVLEAEGVLIDPIGAILAVLVLQVALAPEASTLAAGLQDVALRLGFGTIAGVVAGFLIVGILRVRVLVPPGLENIFTLASVILTFHLSDHVYSHSGVMAVTLAGVVVGNIAHHVDRDLREFKDQITLLLVGMLFVLLAADIRLGDVMDLGWRGAAVVGALVLVVRPIGVFLSTWGSGLRFPEKVFVAWVAPRGIVAAAVTSLTVAAMATADMAGGDELRALVFLTIGSTVILAGFTARPLSMLLRIRLPKRNRVAILGAQGLGLALGRELRDAGTEVVFLDSDPARCNRAEMDGFAVVYGDALEERTLLRGMIELVETAIGLTPNDHLNLRFVAQAKEVGHVPNLLVAMSELPGRVRPEALERLGADVLFGGAHDVARWDVRVRHDDMLVEYLEFRPPGDDGERDKVEPLTNGGKRFVLLSVKREKSTTPMRMGYKPKPGDLASVAIYAPEREDALARLAELGWWPIGAEVAPVEG